MWRYIYPVLDVDFVYGAVASSSSTYNEEAKPVLVTVFPFNSKGSLKDLIYRVSSDQTWKAIQHFIIVRIK